MDGSRLIRLVAGQFHCDVRQPKRSGDGLDGLRQRLLGGARRLQPSPQAGQNG
ncbi:hypothetical protein ACFXJ5_40355 [Streptomyces sp. NPDC059373]